MLWSGFRSLSMMLRICLRFEKRLRYGTIDTSHPTNLEVGELLSQGSKSLRKTQPAGQLDVSSLVGSLQLMAGLLSSSNQHMPVFRSRSPSGKLSPSSRMRLHSACCQMHTSPATSLRMFQHFFWMWHVSGNAWLQCSAHSRLRFRAKSSSRASMLSVEKLGEIDEVHEFLVSVKAWVQSCTLQKTKDIPPTGKWKIIDSKVPSILGHVSF